jgi:hypothetical protein
VHDDLHDDCHSYTDIMILDFWIFMCFVSVSGYSSESATTTHAGADLHIEKEKRKGKGKGQIINE